jgi:hypothetical protein
MRCDRRVKCIRVKDGIYYKPFAWEYPNGADSLLGICRLCQDAPTECNLCNAGSPTKLQATSWSGATLKPVHEIDEYPGFEWCKLGDYP